MLTQEIKNIMVPIKLQKNDTIYFLRTFKPELIYSI